jgi:glycosyltransferase involved in cell wall biosynthesis
MNDNQMADIKKITFVSAVNDQKVFENNFHSSPIFGHPHPHQIIVQRGFASAASAYNDAIDKSENEIIVFCHQDMVFPSDWLSNLQRSLQYLDRSDPNWGVLGCFGKNADGADRGHLYMVGLGTIGAPFEHPEPVRTLDEIVLIINKSSGLRFDTALPHYHFYGLDLCMQAARLGKKCYAIPAFCIHNTQYNLVLPREFYACYRLIKKRWKDQLPIQTTCVRVSIFDLDVKKRRLREFYLRKFERRTVGTERSQSGQELLDQIENNSQPEPYLARRGEKQPCV